MQGLFALEFKSAVAGADRASERVAAGFFHEIFGFHWIRQRRMAVFNFDVFFNTAEHAELGFDGDALFVSGFDDALGDRHVLFERIVRSIDHDGAEEAGVDALVAGFFVTVIEVHRENCFRENFRGRADNRFEHALVGVLARALRDLNNEGSFRLNASLEQAHGLLGIIDIVSADGVLSVGVLEELRGGDDHSSKS